MELFPYKLYRISGLPFDQLAQLPTPDTMEYSKLIDLFNRITAKKENLNRQLTTYARQLSDYQLKSLILNLRRDIYNDRAFTIKIFSTYQAPKLRNLIQEVEAYQRLLAERANHLERWNSYFATIDDQERLYLQQLSDQPELLNGLLLSSISFLERLNKYAQISTERFRKKEKQTERSLLQYLSRIGAKCSPFSSFGYLGLWPESNADNTSGLVSRVGLNNHILSHWKELLASYPPFYRQLNVQLNPSIQLTSTSFIFLLNSRNVESVQRMERDAGTDFIFQLVKNNDKITFGELVKKAGGEIEASDEQLELFLLQILNFGLLEWYWPVSGIEADWIGSFNRMLSAMDRDELLEECMKISISLKDLTKSYPSASFKHRKMELNNITKQLSEFTDRMLHSVDNDPTSNQFETLAFKRFQGQAFPLKREQILFEDCLKPITQPFSDSQLTPLLALIKKVVPLIAPLQAPPIIDHVTDFYYQQFVNKENVPLLAFYELYYQKEWQNNLYTDEGLLKRQLAWLDFLKDKIKVQEGTITLTINDLKQAGERLSIHPQENDQPAETYATLLNIYKSGDKLKAYLDTLTLGYGRMWSRFLPLFPLSVTEAQRQWNRNDNEDEIWLENRDASYFNANIHPPLLSYEVAIPGGHNDLPKRHQIAIDQLEIRASQSNKQVELWDVKNQKKVKVFDLGFEGFLGRSPMYRLLYAFGPPNFQLQLIPQLLSKQFGNKDINGIVHHPRIEFESQIILQRRTWYVPKDQIPSQNSNETAALYYLKLHQWRKSLQIPTKVFITIAPSTILAAVDPDEKLELRQSDDYKPQYIDFDSAAMIRLWKYLYSKVDTHLKIEEMLPNEDQLYTIDNQRYMIECVCQWK